MSNCYKIVTAERVLKNCSETDFQRLHELLQPKGDDPDYHGFKLEWDRGDDKLYMYAPESGNEDMLPEKFLEELGKLIELGGDIELRFGYAVYDDKPRPGSAGGGAFAITKEGILVYPRENWEE